ncbi:hypothetical protein HZR02_15280 [Elizabethkingia anophelis]|nr:hypothetical protein [Elizabethkingia anophelis]MCT3660245.1 hypothetical protein [Elizabethkingia anophelis]MCT3667375.1 hypothetical protein [Elizabethkingia anophelis]MCT3853357.1 hypothetical protein [Elizabethkingia anophelis]MCT3864171.1 hypothetical protein [Elizabethkingia anophelis]
MKKIILIMSLLLGTFYNSQVIQLIDSNTKENVNYQAVNNVPTEKIDGVVYRKKGNQVYKRMFTGSINAKWFGAKGDLSDDYLNLQKAIDVSAVLKLPLYIDEGNYFISQSLLIPNDVVIIGAGAGKTVINNGWQNVSGGVQLKNKDSNTRNITLKDLSFNGGDVFFQVDGVEQSYYTFDNISVTNKSKAGFICNTLFQVNTFRKVYFENVGLAIQLNGATSNFNSFYDCNFLTKNSLEIKNQSEANTFYGCRFEGGGNHDNTPVIFLDNATNINFKGCYFEATGKNILKELRSRSGVTFDDCHFTGAEIVDDKWSDSNFISDGVVHFNTPYFGESAGVVKNYSLKGNAFGELGKYSNLILDNSESHFSAVKSNLWFNTNKIKLLEIERPSKDFSNDNIQGLVGKIDLSITFFKSGGFLITDYFIGEIIVQAASGYDMELRKEIKSIDNKSFSLDLVLEKSDKGAILYGILTTNVPQSEILRSFITYKVDFIKNTTTPYKNLKLLIE